MKVKIEKLCVQALIVLCLLLPLVLVSCEKEEDDWMKQTDAENNVAYKAATTTERHTCNGMDVPITGSDPNCHAFAWQCDYGVPTGLPDYYMGPWSVSKFWTDGNYSPNRIPSFHTISESEVGWGDKVTYGSGGWISHSAIVKSTNPLRFISYCMSYDYPRIHRKDDPAGRYYYEYDNQFGPVRAYYHPSHTTGCEVAHTSGKTINVIYSGENESDILAAEVDGWNYTAYRVRNIDRVSNYFYWHIVVNRPNSDNFHTQGVIQDETSSYNIKWLFNYFKDATSIDIYVLLYPEPYESNFYHVLHDRRYRP